MPTHPKVAVIILNWNGFDDTVECLESFKKLNYDNYKIVLVDNGSSNNEGIRLENMFPEIYLIQNRENRGFSGGNNDGINWALDNGYEYVVNLNNDCIVTEDWLLNLIKAIDSEKADFASSRIMFYPDTKLIYSCNDILFPDLTIISTTRYEEFNNNREIKQVFIANGAASIYSRKCLEEVRLGEKQFFDELYFAYGEDVDLGLRISSKPYKGICVSDAVVYHKQSRTAVKYSDLTFFLSEKNRILNEIFHYPFYLIWLPELFFLLKSIIGSIYSVCNKKSIGYRYFKNINFIKVVWLMIKARFSVILQAGLILKNKKERKHKGLMGRKIFNFFCWNIFSILK